MYRLDGGGREVAALAKHQEKNELSGMSTCEETTKVRNKGVCEESRGGSTWTGSVSVRGMSAITRLLAGLKKRSKKGEK